MIENKAKFDNLDIRVCIQKSDCLQKDNHTFHECLKDKEIRPTECEEFIYGYYQCKHDQVC